MNRPFQLQTPGLELPSQAYIIGAVLFGLVDMVAWHHERRTCRPAVTRTGLGLMLYPYAVTEIWMLWAVGMALCVWLHLKCNE